MQKGIIIYKGKYGATQQYAGWLAEALDQPVMPCKTVTETHLQTADSILLGTAVYIGKLLISDWMKQNLTVLQNKQVFLFVVCGSDSPKEQEKIIKQNIPQGLIAANRIFFLPGRLIFSKLSWIDKLLLRIGALQAKNPETRRLMLADKDNVKKEHLTTLINAYNTQHSAITSSAV